MRTWQQKDIRSRLLKAVDEGKLTMHAAEAAAESLDVGRFKPLYAEAVGYLFSAGNKTVVCQLPTGTNDNMPEDECSEIRVSRPRTMQVPV